MLKNLRASWCEINLDNLIYNYESIKNLVGAGNEVMPVIKADAYGHGAVMCARTLINAGTSRFAVAMIEEGIQLRRAGITCPILILGYIPCDGIDEMIKWNLTPTIYTIEFAQKLSLKAPAKINVHIKIDTGMGRIGFRGSDESLDSVIRINGMNNIFIEGIYSHFAVADEKDKSYTIEQIAVFKNLIDQLEQKGIKIPLKHLANSAGIIDLAESYYNCVRPGIILFGLYPSEEVNKNNIYIKPVKTFKTTVSNIKMISRGDTVSYGRKYIAPGQIKVATVSVGYADGYSRLLSNKGEVIINGEKAKIIGSVCMDQCIW